MKLLNDRTTKDMAYVDVEVTYDRFLAVHALSSVSNLASWPTLFLPRLLQDADDGEQGPEMCQELLALRQLIDMHIHIVLGIRRCDVQYRMVPAQNSAITFQRSSTTWN